MPPLDGITVVAIEQAIAAPLCTRQLAELGARVIKVERRETGDFARHYDARTRGLSSHFVWTNRSKESFTLDLKHGEADAVLHRLLATADIFVQNLAPNAAARMGLGFAQLHEQFPELIVCNITGYGEVGPYADKKAYDLLVQAEAGFLSVTGLPDQMVKSGISIADIAAGMQAYSGILAALIQRGRTGKGSCVDISMLEAMVEWMGFPLNYAYDGASPPARSGADHASIYPYGAFTTGDNKVIMLGLQNEREWRLFCEAVLAQPQLIDDPAYAKNSARSENRTQLQAIIQSVFAGLPEQQLCAKLDAAQIAYARVNDMAAVWQHPQLQALQRFIEFDSPAGKLQGLLPPGNNSSFDAAISGVPALGEHTAAILHELGFTNEEIESLVTKKVV